jgi:quercetin dioxygenase-like cupin family protein
MPNATFYCWNDIEREQVTPQLDRRLLTGKRVMLAQVRLQAGCIVPRHQHEHEQLTYVVSGALHFWIGDDESQERTLRADEVIHLPSDIWHRAVALEDTVVLDVFSPPRQDWLDGSDAYLRR